MEILKVEDLTFQYPLSERTAVRSASFAVNSGEFVVLCGATGSGKSTLLRCLKPEIAPTGTKSGNIVFQNAPLDVGSERIGFVAQRPDEQIVTDRVYSELAFGLENLGTPSDVIARKIAEISAFFGIEDWFERDVATLSGGQKQLLNLAAVTVTEPDLILLDEPTSMLDPIAASDFISMLKKLNRELSLTVVIAEHRTEDAVAACDRIIFMANGAIVADGDPQTIAAVGGDILPFMPAATRLYHMVGGTGACPVDVRDGKRFAARFAPQTEYETKKNKGASTNDTVAPKKRKRDIAEAALEFNDVYFKYDRKSDDVLSALELSIYENEIFCLLGGNGSGKSTLLSCACGLRKPYGGNVRVFGKKISDYRGGELYSGCVSLLPQDVQTLFLRASVREELEDAYESAADSPIDLSPLFEKHPYDLSGGEQQLLALAKVLSRKPRLLLMDEPTKGLDPRRKDELRQIIKDLRAHGTTILAVTHDVEFAASTADRCAILFRGKALGTATPRDFFSYGSFYTTAAARMARGYFEGVATTEDLAAACLKSLEIAEAATK